MLSKQRRSRPMSDFFTTRHYLLHAATGISRRLSRLAEFGKRGARVDEKFSFRPATAAAMRTPHLRRFLRHEMITLHYSLSWPTRF